jgi:hypothetical protein
MSKSLVQILKNFFFDWNTKEIINFDINCDVDVDALSKELGIEKLAVEAASHELPNSSATKIDGNELKIVHAVTQKMQQLSNSANSMLGKYNTHIENTNPSKDKEQISHLSEYTERRLNGLLAEAERELLSSQKAKREYASHFQQFKQTNNRHAPAEYPESRILHFGVVAILLIVESVLNGYFFAKGSEFGLLGGWMQSIIVAVINIVPSFLLAGLFLFRYSHHVSLWKRVPAIFLFVSFLGLVITFNLGVAHFRDFIAIAPEQAVSLALERMQDSIFSLSDFNSWLLFILGVIFAFIAIADGYKSDDPYPRYGAKQRRLEEMEDDYQSLSTELKNRVIRIRQEFLDKLDDLSDSVNDEFIHLFDMDSQKDTLVAKHTHCIDNYISSANALIGIYRDINKRHRKTDAPSYFDSDVPIKREFLLVNITDYSKRVTAYRKVASEFPSFVANNRNKIEEIYARFVTKIHEIEPAIHLDHVPT